MNNPLPAFRFQVEWGGTRMGFSEVSGLEAEVEVIEYREGNSKVTSARKLPGMTKYGNVTLKRGILRDDDEFFAWLAKGVAGTAERRDLVISLLGEEMEPLKQWKLKNAWPVKYKVSDLDASSTDVAIEELVLANEGIEVDGA